MYIVPITPLSACFKINDMDPVPSYSSDCAMCELVNSYMRCTIKYGVEIAFNGISSVEILLDRRFANGSVNGICGNYNYNGTDDFLMVDGSVPEGETNREREAALGMQWVPDDANDRYVLHFDKRCI